MRHYANMTTTPREAWAALKDGNRRFVDGTVKHPDQDAARRTELSGEQHPFAVLFGCSDSRVAAEIIFDRGLGDLFVVRTAGHVIDPSVLGSIEFGVDLLDTPLIVILGHDSCGAIAAAAHTLETGEQPSGFIRSIVEKVVPSIVNITSAGHTVRDGDGNGPVNPQILGREHVRHTAAALHAYSATVANAVATGKCAIVGLEYVLTDGRVRLVEVIGDIGEEPVAR